MRVLLTDLNGAMLQVAHVRESSLMKVVDVDGKTKSR